MEGRVIIGGGGRLSIDERKRVLKRLGAIGRGKVGRVVGGRFSIGGKVEGRKERGWIIEGGG